MENANLEAGDAVKRVVFRGPVLTSSGYGVHAQQIARWLLSRSDIDVSFQPLPWGITSWQLDKERSSGLIGQILERCVPVSQGGYDVSLQLQLPNEWNTSIAKLNVGLTAGIETDRCNPVWTQACNTMDAIVVPSSHALQSLNGNGISRPKFIVPECYNEYCVEGWSDVTIDTSATFNFLIFGQISGSTPTSDRKNTFFALKWLLEEFANDNDVGIVLKTNVGRSTILDRHQTTEMIKSVVQEIRKNDHPKVTIVHGDMSPREVAGLYRNRTIKALVSTTRGEGFCIPMLDAAVSGLPVIATPWSGHMDYMSKGKFIQLYHQLVEVDKSKIDNEIFMEGSRWADVSDVDFKKKVRKFKQSNDVPHDWASKLSNVLKVEYSFEKIAGMYDSAMKSIGAF